MLVDWLATLGIAAALASTPNGDISAMICSNPASGVSWRIAIDYRRGTVDAQPARIDATKISWFDKTDGGTYTLHRESGELDFVAASSTGGYFVHDRCAKANGSG
jgi:hypothetical protein